MTLEELLRLGRAGGSGVVGGMLGWPMDTAVNVANLAKAGYGVAGRKLGLLDSTDMPETIDHAKVPGTSASISKALGVGDSTGEMVAEFAGGLLAPGPKMKPRRIVSPTTVLSKLDTKLNLPEDDDFVNAIDNTPWAEITPDGLLVDVVRHQKPVQEGAESVRGGVFYTMKGDDARTYDAGQFHGGPNKVEGATLLRNPLFAAGDTGGEVPENAFRALHGEGPFREMQRAIENVVFPVRIRKPTDTMMAIDKFLEQYAPEMRGMGPYIYDNARKGNQLQYALQEAAVGSAARRAGHDSILGYLPDDDDGPRLTELFDVREKTYPRGPHDPTQIWEHFLKESPRQGLLFK